MQNANLNLAALIEVLETGIVKL